MKFLVLFGLATFFQTVTPSSVTIFSVQDTTMSVPIVGVLKIYGINSKNALQLPITPSELTNIPYMDSITEQVDPNPVYNPLFTVNYWTSSAFYTEETFIALEVWNTTNVAGREQMTYVGGKIFTIEQMQQFPQHNNVALMSTGGKQVGILTILWS